MNLGIYVGSFDPVHNGHIEIVNHLLNKGYVDKVIIIPTGSYQDKQDILNVEDRLSMLKVYGSENVIINNNLNKVPYTYQILNNLKDYWQEDLYLIIGSDNLYQFNKWKNIKEILKHKILVIPRDDDCCSDLINNFIEKEQFIVVNDFKQVNISSTKIRELINSDRYLEVAKYLHPLVLDYILKNQLYKKNKKEKQLVKHII